MNRVEEERPKEAPLPTTGHPPEPGLYMALCYLDDEMLHSMSCMSQVGAAAIKCETQTCCARTRLSVLSLCTPDALACVDTDRDRASRRYGTA